MKKEATGGGVGVAVVSVLLLFKGTRDPESAGATGGGGGLGSPCRYRWKYFKSSYLLCHPDRTKLLSQRHQFTGDLWQQQRHLKLSCYGGGGAGVSVSMGLVKWL